jgi:hypothetical protein
MTPMDSAAADETLGESSFLSQAAGAGAGLGAGQQQQQRGGVITESMQKQMGGLEGIDQYELPRAVVTRVAKAEVSTGAGTRETSEGRGV